MLRRLGLWTLRVPTGEELRATEPRSSTYHQLLDQSFSLGHHVLQLGDDLQVLVAALSVPELLLCGLQTVKHTTVKTSHEPFRDGMKPADVCGSAPSWLLLLRPTEGPILHFLTEAQRFGPALPPGWF